VLARSKPVRFSHEPIREIRGDFVRFILIDSMFCDQARKEGAIDSARHIVPCR
jgi:hypothetical protein